MTLSTDIPALDDGYIKKSKKYKAYSKNKMFLKTKKKKKKEPEIYGLGPKDKKEEA